MSADINTPPFYDYLGHPVMPDTLTEEARAILAATESELGVSLALESDLPGEIEEFLVALKDRGWWVQIKTPFQPGTANGDLYWVGLTPLGTSGWNGRPDHHVGDVSLRGALWRAALLALIGERRARMEEP